MLQCRARDVFVSQIPVATERSELWISCIRSSSLTHYAIRHNRLGGLGVPQKGSKRSQRFAIQTLLWSLEFATQIISSTTRSQFETWLEVDVSSYLFWAKWICHILDICVYLDDKKFCLPQYLILSNLKTSFYNYYVRLMFKNCFLLQLAHFM